MIQLLQTLSIICCTMSARIERAAHAHRLLSLHAQRAPLRVNRSATRAPLPQCCSGARPVARECREMSAIELRWDSEWLHPTSPGRQAWRAEGVPVSTRRGWLRSPRFILRPQLAVGGLAGHRPGQRLPARPAAARPGQPNYGVDCRCKASLFWLWKE